MAKKSLRLRCLTFGMRLFMKPKLKYFGSPQSTERGFERMARWMFSVPKGISVSDTGPCAQVTFGTPAAAQAVLYLHGGAFMAGSRRSYRAMAGRLAKRTGATVFLADYPKLQNEPFPAAPNAVLAAWDYLISQGWSPHQIVIAGDSAGGNLAFGLLSAVLQRGQRPAGLLAFSPWTDLTLSGESLKTNARRDPFLPASRMAEATSLYLDGADPADPQASPLFAKFPSPPPVFIQVGADEVLFSDAERMASHVGATLDVWSNVPHVWQIFDARLPEATAAMGKAAAFIQTSLDKAKR